VVGVSAFQETHLKQCISPASLTGISLGCVAFNGIFLVPQRFGLVPFQLNLFLIFTARCYTEHGYRSMCPSVCRSICPSVTFRYRDHIGWNPSKPIFQPNSLRRMHGMSQHGRPGATGTPIKLGRNGGGSVSEQKTSNISETVRDRTKVTMKD